MQVRIEPDPSVPPGNAQAARIQNHLDQVHRAGGGTVSIAPGVYIVTTLFLRSNIELHLERNAIVQAWHELADYPNVESGADNKDQSTCHLIAAVDCENISITGDGVIDGQDKAFWEPARTKEERLYGIFRYTVRGGARQRPSPLVQIMRSRNVRIDGVTIRSAPGWALHVFDCDCASVTNLIIRGDPYGPNTDGIGVNGSRDVRVANCDVDTGDDAIIIKATNKDSVCRNVVVSNCIVASNCAGLGLGADVYGVISDVAFSNCVVKKSLRMIQVQMWFPGQVERAVFSGITGRTFPDAEIENERPIYIDIHRRVSTDSGLGQVREMVFRDIICQSRGRILMTAQDGARIDGVTLNNVVVDVPEIEDPAFTIPRATSMQLSNGSPQTRGVRAAVIADNVDRLTMRDVEYRWPTDSTVPMHGVCLRNVRDLIDDSPRLVSTGDVMERLLRLE